MVKIKIEVELPIEVKGNNFVVDNVPALIQLMATTSVQGNLYYYGIKKQQNKFIVPMKVVEDRIKKLKKDKESIENKIHFIEQVLDATKVKITVK